MLSFDAFDTVISRRLGRTSSWALVERHLGIKNFCHYRAMAESRTTGDIASAYRYLTENGHIPVRQSVELRDAEEHFELDSVFGIPAMMNKISDGDVIVSDYYNSADFLEKLLRKAGLKSDINIISSVNGKRQGTIWNTVPKFQFHYGDDWRSDVWSPQRCGRNAIKVNLDAHVGFLGQKFSKVPCLITRTMALQNPFAGKMNSLYADQAGINIPVLFSFAYSLPGKSYAVTLRDGESLKPILDYVHAKYAPHPSFHASRALYRSESPAYVNYFLNATGGREIVDVHGTGHSFHQFALTASLGPQKIHFITSAEGVEPRKSQVGVTGVIKTGDARLEKLQYSTAGSPYAIDSAGRFLRFDCEYGTELRTVRAAFSSLLSQELAWYAVNAPHENSWMRGVRPSKVVRRALRVMEDSATNDIVEVIDRHMA